MENIPEDQYLKILQFLEKYPNIDYTKAQEIMVKHNYDLIMASKQFQNLPNHNGINNGSTQQMSDEHEQSERKQLQKMRKFFRKRIEKKAVSSQIIYKSKNCISKMCLSLTEKFMPEIIKRKTIRSGFQRLYHNESVLQLRNRSIKDAQLNAEQNNKKALAVIVSDSQKSHCLIQFLKKKQLLLAIDDNFQIVGVIHNELKKYAELSSQPAQSILIVRQNKFEELEILQKFYNEKQILGISFQTIQTLKKQVDSSMRNQILDLRRSAEKLFPANSSIVRNIQIQGQWDEQDEVQQYIEKQQDNILIKSQNKDYERMIAEKTKQDEIKAQKLRKTEEILQERQLRRISIPDEPLNEADEIVVHISFRCPNGSTVSRTFMNSQQCQLLFHWVDLNEQIQFEDEGYGQDNMRKFDLLYSYPPESLKEKLNTELSKIFEEKSVKVVIKQL